MTIKILKGAALTRAVAGIRKKADTFSKAIHETAYGALLHVEDHQCPSHLNKLIDSVPVNYRGMIMAYAKAFGRVAWDTETKAFTFAKGKKSDLDTAFRVSPANYERDTKAAKAADTPFTVEAEIAMIEKFIERIADKGARKKTLSALRGVVQVAKGTAIKQAAPAKPRKGAKPKVVVNNTTPEPVAEAA